MLKKECCMDCWNKKYEWNKYDEKAWKKGYVYCLYELGTRSIRGREQPPSKCPYYLENIL